MTDERLSTTKRLLDGAPYIPADRTNLLESFRKWGWTPPSELKRQEEAAKEREAA